jgi:Arc/MetJ-type ribon-helix-helix transcriptional regulator
MIKYSTISVPKMLHEEIRRTVVEDPRVGYSSVAEFSKEAIRIRLDELRLQLQSGEQHHHHIKDLVAAIEDALKERP